MQDVRVKLNPGFQWQKLQSTRRIFHQNFGINLGNEVIQCKICSIASFGAETWTLRKVDQRHPGSFEMLRWRRMEKISWTDHVRNEEVLLRVKEQRDILHTVNVEG
jgi:hypothetical protein